MLKNSCFQNSQTRSKVLKDHVWGNVINVEDPAKDGDCPIPDAQWVEHLSMSPSELSDWLEESMLEPDNPNAIVAGMGATGAMYILWFHGGQ